MLKDLLPKSSSTEMQNAPNLLPKRDRSGEVIPPDVMMLLALDDMAVRQAIAAEAQLKIQKLEESKVPIGTRPIKRTISDSIYKLPLYPPWISFSLTNDGPGAVTVWINGEEDPFADGMLGNGETYNIDMKYPVIKTIYMKAASGTTAIVRIHGEEGRPNY